MIEELHHRKQTVSHQITTITDESHRIVSISRYIPDMNSPSPPYSLNSYSEGPSGTFRRENHLLLQRGDGPFHVKMRRLILQVQLASERSGLHMSDCKTVFKIQLLFRVMSGSDQVLHTKLLSLLFPLWTHTNTHLLDSLGRLAGNCFENLAEKQNLTQNSSLMAQSS